MDARRGLFSDFALATGVLTRLPVGVEAVEPGAVATAAWAFPLVGVGVGAIATSVFLVAALLGLAAGPAALLTVFAGIAVTGAFHEDGLADTADGFGGGRDREQKLAIMRDSRHGTFGMLALIASIGLRTAALATLAAPIAAALALLAAHAVSRATLPATMRVLAPARPDGLGASAGRPSLPVAITAAAIGALVALTALGPSVGLAALLLVTGAVAATAALAQRQVGGYTGDILGALQQIGEIVMLLVAAAQ